MAGESQQLPDSAPDPSVLTTEAIGRSAVNQQMLRNAELDVLRQRLAGMDEATKVLHETVTRIPTDVQQAVGHLKELTAEKFASVTQRFDLNDDRSKAELVANDTKLSAALSAQKEAAAEQNKANTTAIDKSEKATNETISKNADAAAAANRALSDKIDDLKERVASIENQRIGGQEQRTEARQVTAGTYALGGLIATLVIAVLAAVGFLAANN